MSNPSTALSLRRRLAGAALSLCAAAVAAPAFAGGEPPFTKLGDLLEPRPVHGQAASEVGAPELWGRLFAMLRDSQGGLSKARFEGAFGAPMRESLIGGDAAYYAVNAGQAGQYFDIGLSAYDSRARSSIRSRSARAVDGQKGCVAPQAAV